MILKRNARNLILSALGPAAAVVVVAVFAGFALFGGNGLFQRGEYRRELEVRKGELAALTAERGRLANRKALLARGDPDLADELTREATDMVGNDEYVIVRR